MLLVSLAPDGRAADSTSNFKQIRSTNSITLPSHLDENCFFVQAYIGDEGPFNFILDTGATMLMVSPQVAARLRKVDALRDGEKVDVDTASGAKSKMDFALVRDVHFGDFVVPTPTSEALILDMSPLSKLAGETIDGVAGMLLFQSGTIVLDFPHSEVRLERGEPGVSERTVVLECESNRRVPTFKMEVAGEKVLAQVDSGYIGSFTIPFNNGGVPLLSPQVLVGLAMGADGQTKQMAARLAADIVFGGVKFVRPVAHLSDRDSGLIGRRVLEHFVVGWDQPRHRLLLTPATSEPVLSPPIRSLGFSLLPDERGMKVMGVIPGTDADRARIRRGDYLSSINGRPATAWSQKQLRELRDSADTVEVELLSLGKPKRLKLKVSTLVE